MKMIATKENIRDLILELVTEKKYTQSKIAKKIGMTETSISLLVSGSRTPNNQTIYKLNRFLESEGLNG